MKKSIRAIGIAALGAAALLLPVSADASCDSGVFFGSYYSPITGTSNGPSLRGSFWMMGNGNPVLGAGMDNGNTQETGTWIEPYASLPLAMTSAWGEVTTYDGCPDSLGAGSSMAWALSDLDGTGNMVYAVGCSTRVGTAFVEFDMTNPPGCTNTGCGLPLALVPAPKATISGTSRTAGQATVTVASPNFAPGFYGDGTPGCAQNLVITGYEIFKQEVTRNAAAPTNRDATGGWTSVGTQNIGVPFNFNTACVGDCDVYVSVMPRYNSGFDTGEPATGTVRRVGPSSTRVQAGPIIANPPKPRIANPKKVAGE